MLMTGGKDVLVSLDTVTEGGRMVPRRAEMFLCGDVPLVRKCYCAEMFLYGAMRRENEKNI